MADPRDPQILRLAARVGEEIAEPAELSLAEECLDAAWEWIRLEGDPTWDFTDPATPNLAKSFALSAASRCYQNPSGFVSERGDMVTFERYEDFAKGAELTPQEIQGIRKVARTGGRVTSIRLTNPDIFPARGKGAGNNSQIQSAYVMVGDPYHQPIVLPHWGF